MANEGVKGVIAKPVSKVRVNTARAENTEPQTIVKVQQAAKWIAEGKSRATVKELMSQRYGIALATANDYYNEALKLLIPENEDEWRKNLIKANATRLETIYECAIKAGDWKSAKDAISELNKMIGIGKEGITVGVQNDPESKTQQFIIKINE